MVNRYNKFLDPSTKLVLDEMGEEYKKRIIEIILSDKNITVEDIKMRDLILAEEKLAFNILNKKKHTEKSILIRKLGIIYMLIGMMVLAYEFIQIEFDYITLTALSLITSGVIVTMIVPQFLKKTSYKKDVRNTDVNTLFISNWSLLESTARNMVKEITGKNVVNIRELFEILAEKNYFTIEDIEKIQSLISYRNNIVHGTKLDYTFSELKVLLKVMDELIAKIEKTENSKGTNEL